MNSESPDRLSQIKTEWSLLQDAHAGLSEAAHAARKHVMARYERAVFSYLSGCVRDQEIAKELFQEFWLRFLKGNFRGADPALGSFRTYAKVTLSRMATKYAENVRKARQVQLDDDVADKSPGIAFGEDSDALQESLKQAILSDAWKLLANADEHGSTPLYTVLRLKAEHPNQPDNELATLLGGQLGKAITHANFRKMLQRARERFAEAVYSAVAESLRDATPARVEEELIELELLRYCKSAVAKRAG